MPQAKHVTALALRAGKRQQLPADLAKYFARCEEKRPGEKIKVTITATRKGGYKGPIALDVRKLPAMVTVVCLFSLYVTATT